MAEPTRRRLDQPRTVTKWRPQIDPDSFGRTSERLARFLGTGKFLFWQSMIVIAWITLNITGWIGQWDAYPFILLNLAFSTQAAYAAPLILLAQNRQDDRDRISLEEDRSRALQTRAGTEYLAREIAALRVAINEVATRDYLRGELEKLRTDLEDLSEKVTGEPAEPPAATPRKAGKQKARTDRDRERDRAQRDRERERERERRRERDRAATAAGPADS
nr:DUF1003 domain-containing protein [Nakamurella deserti]